MADSTFGVGHRAQQADHHHRASHSLRMLCLSLQYQVFSFFADAVTCSQLCAGRSRDENRGLAQENNQISVIGKPAASRVIMLRRSTQHKIEIKCREYGRATFEIIQADTAWPSNLTS